MTRDDFDFVYFLIKINRNVIRITTKWRQNTLNYLKSVKNSIQISEKKKKEQNSNELIG